MKDRADEWGITLLRLVLGAIFIIHGVHTLVVLGVGAAAGILIHLGYPPSLAPALAWYLVVVHTVGGVLIILGWQTRLAALLQVPILGSALLVRHLSQGFMLRVFTVDTADGARHLVGGAEYALLVLAATLTLVLAGGGARAMDRRYRGPRIEIP